MEGVAGTQNLRAVVWRCLPYPILLSGIPLVANLSKKGELEGSWVSAGTETEECVWTTSISHSLSTPTSLSPLLFPPPTISVSLCLGSSPLSLQCDTLHMEENVAANSFQFCLLGLPLTDLVPSTENRETEPTCPAWSKGHEQGHGRPEQLLRASYGGTGHRNLSCAFGLVTV